MKAKFWIALALAGLMPLAALGDDKAFRLSVPDTLMDSPFLKHLLPRFGLKTGVKIELVREGIGADAHFGSDGIAVFAQGEIIWHLNVDDTEDPDAVKFRDWLTSDIGRNTIESYDPQSGPVFTSKFAANVEEVVVVLTGDAKLGETISYDQCGRCHVIGERNRMNGMASAPSFALMRTFDDWQDRFQAFFTLKPHPAFTQITGITAPFDEGSPSPIVPIEITLGDIDAIMAFVASVEPADLGAPLQSQ
jgi:hypothetical protein